MSNTTRQEDPMTTTTQTRIARISYEMSECARCGGEGRINAYGHVHGGVCFGCHGGGRVYTRTGAAAVKKANAWKAEHLMVPVASLTTSSRVVVTNMRGRKVTVTVETTAISETVTLNGQPVLTIDTVDAQGNRTGRSYAQDAMIQRAVTQDDLQALAVHLARNSGATVEYA
jgi:hypothetical protein